MSNPSDKSRIVDYILVNLSKKGIKAINFCNAAGLSINTISYIKYPTVHNKVSSGVWDFLKKVHETSSFDKVMAGEMGYVPKVKINKTDQDNDPATDAKEVSGITTVAALDHARWGESGLIMDMDHIEKHTMKSMTIPASDANMEQGLTQEEIDSMIYKIQSIPDGSPKPAPVITIGDAITALIDHGFVVEINLKKV